MLPSDHSTPCPVCLKPAASANSNPTKSLKETLGDGLLPVKDTQSGSSKARWCVQSADTHSQSAWGGSWAGRARQKERGGSSGAGWAPRQRLHRGTHVPLRSPTQGWWEQSAAINKCHLAPRPNSDLASCPSLKYYLFCSNYPHPQGKNLKEASFCPPVRVCISW